MIRNKTLAISFTLIENATSSANERFAYEEVGAGMIPEPTAFFERLLFTRISSTATVIVPSTNIKIAVCTMHMVPCNLQIALISVSARFHLRPQA